MERGRIQKLANCREKKISQFQGKRSIVARECVGGGGGYGSQGIQEFNTINQFLSIFSFYFYFSLSSILSLSLSPVFSLIFFSLFSCNFSSSVSVEPNLRTALTFLNTTSVPSHLGVAMWPQQNFPNLNLCFGHVYRVIELRILSPTPHTHNYPKKKKKKPLTTWLWRQYLYNYW